MGNETREEMDRLRETQRTDYEYLLGRLQLLEKHLKIKYRRDPRYEEANSEQEKE